MWIACAFGGAITCALVFDGWHSWAPMFLVAAAAASQLKSD